MDILRYNHDSHESSLNIRKPKYIDDISYEWFHDLKKRATTSKVAALFRATHIINQSRMNPSYSLDVKQRADLDMEYETCYYLQLCHIHMVLQQHHHHHHKMWFV
jgi:two-component SAPR family response regulator